MTEDSPDDATTTTTLGDRRASTASEHSHRLQSRRDVLAAAAAGAASLAGCTGGTDDDNGASSTSTTTETAGSGDSSSPTLVAVADTPDAVYVPTHFESARMLDPVRAGDFEFVPMVTYPHRFWTVFGDERDEVRPTDGEDVHLMVSVRDPETGTVLPVDSGLELAVRGPNDSGRESTHAPWPMLSQEMGFHFGDNLELGPDGTYEMTARVGAVGAETTGAFAGRFDEAATASFSFTFDQAFRDEVVAGISYLPEDQWGRPGALANQMGGGGETDGASAAEGTDHRGRERWLDTVDGRRFGTFRRAAGAADLPPADDLPGTLLGTPTTGDAVFAVTLLGPDSRFVDDRGHYVAVSSRTPYNRSALPMLSLAYEQTRDGDLVAGGETDLLAPALDPELGYHYGTTLSDVAAGDILSVAVETPSQASRHAGYQTAFFETDVVEVVLQP